MTWIFFAISAHFFWALVNVGDKYVVGNRVSNPYVYLVWLNMVGILGILFIPFVDFIIPNFQSLLWIGAAGALFFFGGFPYMKAVQLEEISRINIWWNLIPIFSLAFGWFFLGESFSAIQLIPFLFLIAGAFLASIHSQKKHFIISPAFLLMIVACIAFTGYAVILRYVTQSVSFPVVYIWMSIFMFIYALTPFVSKKFTKDFVQNIKRMNGSLAGAVVGVSFFEHLGIFFNIWALSLGPVAYVYAMEGFQVIFVFIIATLISVFAPSILREDLDKKNILLKLTAILIMITGIILLAFQQ